MYRRNRAAQSPKGSAPARRAIRRSIVRRRRTASRCSPGELCQRRLLRGERVQQRRPGATRSVPAAVRASRSPVPATLCADAICAASACSPRAERRVRLLHAVEHHRAIHEVGEGVGSQQVRGGCARAERHERLSRAIVQPGLHGLHVRLRWRESCWASTSRPWSRSSACRRARHVGRQRQDPALERGGRCAGVHDLPAERGGAPPRAVSIGGLAPRRTSPPSTAMPTTTRPPRCGGRRRSACGVVTPPTFLHRPSARDA